MDMISNTSYSVDNFQWNGTDNKLGKINHMTRRTEYKIGMAIITHILPVVIVLGTVGNMLSFIVLMRKRMRYTSVYFYLAMLACADTVVLYSSGFKTWIRIVSGKPLSILNG